MSIAKTLAIVSPFPVVDLNDITVPQGGLLYELPSICKKNYSKDQRCKEHYARMQKSKNEVVQCPFGFCSYAIECGSGQVALTSFVPLPRMGGSVERTVAKKMPEVKVSRERILYVSEMLKEFYGRTCTIEAQVFKENSKALHEIRKLNRTVKQTAERLCLAASPNDPDLASPELVRIWKTSEIMSQQFDIIEILANESLATLPLNSEVEPYKLIDKCVRIYRALDSTRRIKLTAHSGFFPRVLACDKTFPIIATVLIENAMKYSIQSTEIAIELSPLGDTCLLEVSSMSTRNDRLDDQIFKKGYRATNDDKGTGHGLYLAQLVAKQHKTSIGLKAIHIGDRTTCIFSVPFQLAKTSRRLSIEEAR